MKFAWDVNGDGDFNDTNEIITVDNSASVGAWTSLAFDASGNPAISYRDDTSSDLKFAWDKNGDGDFNDTNEIIVPDSAGNVGTRSSLAFDTSGRPAICYFCYYCPGGMMKLAWDKNNDGDFDDTNEITFVDSGLVGEAISLAFDASGNPAISYRNWSAYSLKFAWDTSGNGIFESGEIITVDDHPTNNLASYTSLAFDALDRPAISYPDDSANDLKFAYDLNDDGDFADANEIIVLDSSTTDVLQNSLAFDASGYPAISYFAAVSGGSSLKLARYIPPDTDGDGIPDDVDNCPSTVNPSQTDSDSDGVGDACDNCPSTVNPSQTDSDSDGVGDACDNCPSNSNPSQTDNDSDGVGDACDNCPNDPNNDADGDGICGDVDNCPSTVNPSQTDSDSDGLGDACDSCPNDPNNDADGDGICGDVDNCPSTVNPSQTDSDSDGVGDACDNCPYVVNSSQTDNDSDGVGDACDSDYTPTGLPVSVNLDPVYVTYENVTIEGTTNTASSSMNQCGATPEGYQCIGFYRDITKTATCAGKITVGIRYSEVPDIDENTLRLFHCENGQWVDRTTSLNATNNIVYGEVDHLSWFFIGGRWVYVSGVPVFPSVYLGIAAAFGAAVLAFVVRRRFVRHE